MTEQHINQKENFKRKVWITKNSRISLAERYLKKDRNLEYLNFYYSICVIGLSLFGLVVEKNVKEYNLLLIFLSIVISMVVLFSNTKNYKEKALKLKSHYIELEKIYHRFDLCVAEEELDKLKDSYFQEIEGNENHKKIDWIVSIRNDEKECEKYNKMNCLFKAKFKILEYIDNIVLFIMILIPVFVWVYLVM